MILPQRVDKECLHCVLFVSLDRVDGIHQVRVVQHHLSGLLGKYLSWRIDDVDEACVSEILDIVHHSGATRANLLCQFADVWSLWTFERQHVEELLYLGEVFQFNLLDEQYVYLSHHVHRLEQIFREVPVLQEERIESVVDVVLEVLHRTGLWQDLLDESFVVVEYLIQGEWLKVVASQQVDVLSEGEASQIVALHNAVEFGVLLLQSHHARSSEHYLQSRVLVVASTQLLAPFWLFEHLVDEQYLAAATIELACEVSNAMSLKVEVVHVDV